MSGTLHGYVLHYANILKRHLIFKHGVTPIKEEEGDIVLTDSSYPNNFEKYPFNIFEPEVINVSGDKYIRYKAKFSSLHDLYEYLKSHPATNRTVFSSLSSEDGDRDFAGVPFHEALEELENPPRSEYREFLELSEKLDDSALGYVEDYISIKSPCGGAIDIPAYSSGDPFCYRTGRSIYTPKFIRINVMLSYNCSTTKKQVMNRALIVASLVNAFEKAGYIVVVNTFELSKEDNEICEIDVNIKNSDETFNKASLYKSLCYVEFLRRLLFRVLETLDVQKGWNYGYGSTCSESFTRRALRLDKDDIFIDEPDDMGIRGKDIGEDFRAVLKHLKIADKIDVEKATEEFDRDIMRLQKTIK